MSSSSNALVRRDALVDQKRPLTPGTLLAAMRAPTPLPQMASPRSTISASNDAVGRLGKDVGPLFQSRGGSIAGRIQCRHVLPGQDQRGGTLSRLMATRQASSPSFASHGRITTQPRNSAQAGDLFHGLVRGSVESRPSRAREYRSVSCAHSNSSRRRSSLPCPKGSAGGFKITRAFQLRVRRWIQVGGTAHQRWEFERNRSHYLAGGEPADSNWQRPPLGNCLI